MAVPTTTGRLFAATSEPSEIVPVHAYSHVNSFNSAAMAFAVTGDDRYLRICTNAYDFIQRTQCYATAAASGPDERLMPPDGSLGRSARSLCPATRKFRAALGLARSYRAT